MKKTILMLAALTLGAFSAKAQEAAAAITTPAAAPEATSLSMSSTLGYESKYVFRGVQLADEIFTPAVDLTYGNFYGGLWFAFAEDSADPYPTEMDLYAGYNFKASSLLTIDVGATRYAYDRVIGNFMGKDNSLEFYTGVSLDVLLSPSAYVYYDIDLHYVTFEGKLGHSFNLVSKLSLNLGVAAGYVVSSENSDNDYAYASATADLAYAITDKSSFSIGARAAMADYESFYGSYHDVDTGRNGYWFGASFSTGF
jgi:uncharacterized protein (TIGR02001 family)